ncbi:hypothetical protein [Propionibacterium freudenreichii]|uniref:hypothetical protein n=1 Tax=Propionibacterium freudenreichii TaxID=1744 RepID=UPI000762C03D|nr:hypothetical protein [Propionibacterium freudenreichii]
MSRSTGPKGPQRGKAPRQVQGYRVSVNPDGTLLTNRPDGELEEVAKDFRELTARLSLRGEQQGLLILPVVIEFSKLMQRPSLWPVVLGAGGRLRRPTGRQSFINAIQTGSPYEGEFVDTTLVEVGKDVTEMSASNPMLQWVPVFLILTPDGQLADLGETIMEGRRMLYPQEAANTAPDAPDEPGAPDASREPGAAEEPSAG